MAVTYNYLLMKSYLNKSTRRKYEAAALVWSYAVAGSPAVALADTMPTETPQNIALNRPVSFADAPNYELCTDGNDALQLTDGEYTKTESSLWADKRTVGWVGVSPVIITIDLGKTQPISGFSYNTAGGISGVGFPYAIQVAVSEDKKTWRYAGDLVTLSHENGEPVENTYNIHRYFTHGVRTAGRYVSFTVQCASAYLFCDEIEIYRGQDAWLQHGATGEAITNLKEFAARNKVSFALQRRLRRDIEGVSAAVQASSLPEARKRELETRLSVATTQNAELPAPDLGTFTTVFPINSVQAEIYSVYGEVLRSRGLAPLTAWKRHRYAPLQVLDAPSTKTQAPAVSVRMLGNEHRADDVLLTNSTGKAINARLRVSGLPGGANPAWLKVSAIPWTDTIQNIPVAAALPPAPFKNGAYEFSVPAGLTRKLWLAVDSRNLKPGKYAGKLAVESAVRNLQIPFEVQVSAVKMNRPRFSLTMWDYTDGKGEYDINPGNLKAAIDLQKSHYVDSPFAQITVLPLPKAEDYGAGNELKTALDFSVFDQWIKRWPDARHYFVFLNAPHFLKDGFAGAAVDSLQFHQRFGAWVRAVAAHMRTLKRQPEQLGFLAVDEPQTDAQAAIAKVWQNAIKDSKAGIGIFLTPSWDRPDELKEQSVLTTPTVLCPGMSRFSFNPEVGKYYGERLAAGQKLWVYSCAGPTRLFDPQAYFRLQSWHSFKWGATGMGFWAFGDNGAGPNSWNDYGAKSAAFTPVFLTPNGATDAIYWQAVREGVEDYEYLAMLRDAARASKNPAYKQRANALLDKVSNDLWKKYSIDFDWAKSVGHQQVDDYRLQVLAMLEER